MLSNATTTALPPRRFRSGRVKLGAAAGGVLLAVCAVAGVAAWQVGSRSTGHPAARPAAVLPAAAGVPAAARTSPAPQLILAGSAEQAARVQASFNDADALGAASGAPPITPQIWVVDPSQATQTLWAVAEQNNLRASLGLPEIVVTDLTQSEGGVRDHPVIERQAHAAPAAAVYLAGSQQQADTAQAALDAADVEAGKFGVTSPAARLLVVSSDEDAAAWRSMVADENALRATLGLAEIELVDLR